MRTECASALVCLAMASAFAGGNAAAGEPPAPAAASSPRKSEPAGVPGTRDQVFDAWLACDAAVVGTYRGVDSTLGPNYHVLEVNDVWMGTPARGRLVFKAPRGMRGDRGAQVLLMLWDRLAGASDGFIEESKARYGDQVWQRIGPDSLATYLLPFSSYAYPFEKNKLVLRGQGAFPTEIPIAKLRGQLQEFETSLAPPSLYKKVDTVMRARVQRVQLTQRTEHGIVVERWVIAGFKTLEAFKGQAPDTLQMRYISFPRSPRFKADEDVLLFLTQGPEGPYLAQGKRAVLHVVKGEVLEAGQPLAEFVKTLGRP